MLGRADVGFWGAVMIPESGLGKTLRLEAVAADGSHILLRESLIERKISPEELELERRYNLPDEMLRHLVVSNADPKLFVQRGKEGVELIKTILREHDIDVDLFANILDFGVGCGRILRWWEEHSSRINFWGSDINEELIRWCRQNIRFARFSVNELHPPTAYHDGQFDLIYAYSVFTHLRIESQKSWLAEFARILQKGRYAVISVHGDHDAATLLPELQNEYRAKGYLIMSGTSEGENMCACFQTNALCKSMFSEQFEVIAHLPGARVSTSKQDIYLLQKR